MPKFQEVAEGLHYGDSASKICTELSFCGMSSYLYNTPHGIYKPPLINPLK